MSGEHGTDGARERELRAALERLPRSVDPGEDLRPGIRALRERRRRAGMPAGAPRRVLAAAAVLVAAAGVTLALVVARSGAGEAPEGAAVVLALDAEYDRAGDELKARVAESADRLDPAAMRLLFEDLGTVEAALAEAREALRRDPVSPLLGELVMAAHRQRMDVLRRATDLASGSEEAS